MLPIPGQTTTITIDVENLTHTLALLRKLQLEQDTYSDAYEILGDLILSIELGM